MDLAVVSRLSVKRTVEVNDGSLLPALSQRTEANDDDLFQEFPFVGFSGSINPNPKMQSSRSCPLVCTHKAEGHTKPILSVDATDDMLFSSSKDRTAKIWDLYTGQELTTLTGHPNNVNVVRYSATNRLVYTVSSYFIKVWDMRDGNKCIKTLK